jgi:hypothetical protein
VSGIIGPFKTSYPLFLYRVTPLVLEAFLVRLYREKNKTGFVTGKSFTDQPEHITSAIPYKEHHERTAASYVHFYPRYYSPVRLLSPYSRIGLDFTKKLRHLLNNVEQMSLSFKFHRI